MTKKIIYFIILVLFSMALLGCIEAGATSGTGSNPGGGSDEGEGSDPADTISSTEIRFDIGDVAQSAEAGNNLFYLESSYRTNTGDVEIRPLLSGTNTVQVSTNRNVVMGVVHVPDPAAPSVRDLGSAISLIGTIEVTSAGLDTIPVSEQPEPEIDLGDVTIDDTSGTIESPQGTSEIADDTGYDSDTLDTYGNYDRALLKYANLDIDRNGVPDNEDQLQWSFITQTIFDLEANTYSVANDSFLGGPETLTPNEFMYMFVLQDFDEYQFNPTQYWNMNGELFLPPNAAQVASIYQMGTYSVSPYSDDIGYARYWKFATTDPALLPLSPIEGDYRVYLEDSLDSDPNFEFFLDDLAFVRPENDYEGLIFPVIDFESGADDVVTTVGWQWKTIVDGQFLDATPDEVRLQIKMFILAFTTPEDQLVFVQREFDDSGIWWVFPDHQETWYGFKLGDGIVGTQNNDMMNLRTDFGVSYWDATELDVSSYDFVFDHDTNSLATLTEDGAGNFYGYLNSTNADIP